MASCFNRAASHLSVDKLLHRIDAADGDLLAWRSSTPGNLQPDRKPLYARRQQNAVADTEAEMLHSAYYNVLVIIQRVSLVSVAASDAVCLGAARALIRSAKCLVLAVARFQSLMGCLSDTAKKGRGSSFGL